MRQFVFRVVLGSIWDNLSLGLGWVLLLFQMFRNSFKWSLINCRKNSGLRFNIYLHLIEGWGYFLVWWLRMSMMQRLLHGFSNWLRGRGKNRLRWDHRLLKWLFFIFHRRFYQFIFNLFLQLFVHLLISLLTASFGLTLNVRNDDIFWFLAHLYLFFLCQSYFHNFVNLCLRKLSLEGCNVFPCSRITAILNFDGILGSLFRHKDRCKLWEFDRIDRVGYLLGLGRRIRWLLIEIDDWRVVRIVRHQ